MSRTDRNKMPVVLILLATVLLMAGPNLLAQDDTAAKSNQAKEAYNEGITLMQAGDNAAAILAFTSAITLDGDYSDAFLNLGVIYFGEKEYDQALQNFKFATEKNDQNADAWANLGRVQNKLKRRVEAEQAFLTALAIEPDNGEFHKELGKIQYLAGRPGEAVGSFEKCHEANAGDHVSYLYLGKAHQKTKNMSGAIGSLQKSIELKSDYYSSRFALGSIYLAQEKYSKAATQFKAALKASPKKYRASYNYAVSMESLEPDDIDANVANWTAFVKLAKNNAKARDDLATAEQHVKDLKDRKEKLKEAGF